MFPEIIKKIYVINLKSCVDRKKHIIEEFKKLKKIPKNSKKLYAGKIYKKPVISNDIYNKIDDSLKKELVAFCKRHKYEHSVIKI